MALRHQLSLGVPLPRLLGVNLLSQEDLCQIEECLEDYAPAPLSVPKKLLIAPRGIRFARRTASSNHSDSRSSRSPPASVRRSATTSS